MNIESSPKVEVIHKIFPQYLSTCCVPRSSGCWHSASSEQTSLPDAAYVLGNGGQQITSVKYTEY